MIEMHVEQAVSHLPRGMSLRAPGWDVPPEPAPEVARPAAAVYEELRAGGDR